MKPIDTGDFANKKLSNKERQQKYRDNQKKKIQSREEKVNELKFELEYCETQLAMQKNKCDILMEVIKEVEKIRHEKK